MPGRDRRELLLRVDAAGLCHSDLHVMDARRTCFPTAALHPGSRGGRNVVAVGDDAGVPDWLERRVAVHGVWSCGRVSQCAAAAGRTTACDSPAGRWVAAWGGTGAWPSSCWCLNGRTWSKPQGLDPESSGAAHRRRTDGLARGGRTPIPRWWGTALVGGLGGLGQLAIQLLLTSGRTSWRWTRVARRENWPWSGCGPRVVEDLSAPAAALLGASGRGRRRPGPRLRRRRRLWLASPEASRSRAGAW